MRLRGFTLVELLVILTISAILVALAVPSFLTTIRRSEISSASNSMIAALDLARSEAIRRNSPVVVCRSMNAQAPQPACSVAAGNGFAADDWAAGWIVFAKLPTNLNQGQFEAGDEVVARQAALAAGGAPERVIIESNRPGGAFQANGLLAPNSNATVFIDRRDIQVGTRSPLARCLVTNVTGRSRVAEVVNNVCPAA